MQTWGCPGKESSVDTCPDLADDLTQKRSDVEEELRVRSEFHTMMGFILLEESARE